MLFKIDFKIEVSFTKCSASYNKTFVMVKPINNIFDKLVFIDKRKFQKYYRIIF